MVRSILYWNHDTDVGAGLVQHVYDYLRHLFTSQYEMKIETWYRCMKGGGAYPGKAVMLYTLTAEEAHPFIFYAEGVRVALESGLDPQKAAVLFRGAGDAADVLARAQPEIYEFMAELAGVE